MTDNFNIDIKEYKEKIIEIFAQNEVPLSNEQLVKNWLQQTSVRREVVFLLGFGLKMTLEEVSDCLKKWLKERDFNPKCPMESICYYCFKNNLNHSDMLRLEKAFDDLQITEQSSSSEPGTKEYLDELEDIQSELRLLKYLAKLKNTNKKSLNSVTSHKILE